MHSTNEHPKKHLSPISSVLGGNANPCSFEHPEKHSEPILLREQSPSKVKWLKLPHPLNEVASIEAKELDLDMSTDESEEHPKNELLWILVMLLGIRIASKLTHS